MKKFMIDCDFGGQMQPFSIYIGQPEDKHHPLHFQADWLSKDRGGVIPGEIMEAVSKLHDLSKKNGVSLEELCVYALGSSDDSEEAETQDDDAGDEEDVAASDEDDN